MLSLKLQSRASRLLKAVDKIIAPTQQAAGGSKPNYSSDDPIMRALRNNQIAKQEAGEEDAVKYYHVIYCKDGEIMSTCYEAIRGQGFNILAFKQYIREAGDTARYEVILWKGLSDHEHRQTYL